MFDLSRTSSESCNEDRSYFLCNTSASVKKENSSRIYTLKKDLDLKRVVLGITTGKKMTSSLTYIIETLTN